MNQLNFFFLIWAASKISGLLAFNSHMIFFPNMAPYFLFLVTISLVIANHKSTILFLILCFFQISISIQRVPAVGNHVFFGIFIEATFIGLILNHFFIARKNGRSIFQIDQEELHENFSQFIRYELIAIYAMSAFHKLNLGFFDPNTSCAVQLFNDINKTIEILPKGNFMNQLSIYGTIFLEIATPCLLFFNRSFKLGILFALGMHFLFGFHNFGGIQDFSFMGFCLIILIFPKDWFQYIAIKVKIKNSELILKLTAIYIFATFTLTAISEAPFAGALNSSIFISAKAADFRNIGSLYWYLFASATAGSILFILFKCKVKLFDYKTSENKSKLIYFFPLIIFAFGFAPYLGVRTIPALSMFSNLQTYGENWNHLILPKKIKYFDWEEQLVEVTATNSPWLGLTVGMNASLNNKDNNVIKSKMPLKGVVSLLSIYDSQAEILKDNKIVRIDSRGGHVFVDGIDLFPNVILNRLFSFRAIDESKTPKCSW